MLPARICAFCYLCPAAPASLCRLPLQAKGKDCGVSKDARKKGGKDGKQVGMRVDGGADALPWV